MRVTYCARPQVVRTRPLRYENPTLASCNTLASRRELCQALKSLRWQAQLIICARQTHFRPRAPTSVTDTFANMGNTFASAELPTGPVECSYTPPLKVNPANPKVFFDMMIGSAQIGRIVMELKADVAPSAHIKSRAPDSLVDLCAGSTEDGGELPGAVHGREGLRLQGLLLPPRDSEVHVSGW